MNVHPNDHQHPPYKQLVVFALGDLPDELHDEIEKHIATCDECCQKLQQVPNDDFVLNLKSDLAKNLGDPVETSGIDATLPGQGTKVRYFGDYELLEEIARGGMGVVYKARQSKLNRIVALKMILGRHFASVEQVQRFQREAETAAGLTHQGIVPIYEVGEHDGLQFYSMQFVDGQSLADKTKAGPIPVMSAAKILRDCARAIGYAHQSKLIHRDLKPANILIDRDGHPCITDFGLAKQTDGNTELTASGQVMGTPGYMSPEQASGRTSSIDQRSDVYGLGATLYATITGRPPFQADNTADTLVQVVELDPVSPQLLNPKVPKDLETICLKCLEKDPAHRYQTAGELSDELSCFIEGLPIRARPISRAAKTMRWCKRNPLVASVSTLAVLILVVGSIVSTYFAILASSRYENERRQKSLAQDRQRMADEAKQDALDAKVIAQKETANTKRALFDSQRSQYFNLMNSALLEWQANNPQRARELLRLATELESWDRLGHWEWEYLWNLVHPESEVLEGHSDWVLSVALSPVENRLASCGKDRSIRIVDLDRQKTIAIENAHEGPVYSIAFSPDGKLLASGSQDNSIRLWNTSDGTLVGTLSGHDGTVECIAFTRDGSRMITAARDQMIKTWDVENRSLVDSFQQPFAHVYRFSLSPDDKHISLVAGGNPNGGGKVLVYELESGELVHRLEGVNSFATAVQYSPNGDKIVAGTYDGSIISWNATTGDVIENRKLHENYVTSVAFNPAGTLLASACSDIQKMGGAGSGEIVICHLEEFGNNVLFRGHHERVRHVAFDRLGTRIASAGYDKTVRLWETNHQKSSIPLQTEQGTLFDVSINKNCSQFATVGRNVKIWDTNNNQQLLHFQGHSKWINRAVFSSDGIHIASGGRDEPILVWDSTTGKEVGRFEAHQDELKSIQFYPDGNRVLSADKKNVFVWNFADDSDGFSITFSGGVICYATVDRRGQCIAVACEDGSISLFGEDRSFIKKIAAHRSIITCLRYSPDSNILASTSLDGSAKLWNAATGELIHSLEGHTRPVHGIAFSPDGRRVASASRDTLVKLWDVATGSPVLTLRGHPEGVLGVDWSADGSQIISVGYGSNVIVWNGQGRERGNSQGLSIGQN